MKKIFQAPWSLKEVIIIVISSATLLVSTSGLLSVTGAGDKFNIYQLFIIQWLLLLIPLIVASRAKKRLKLQYFGIEKTKISTTIGLILGGYVVYTGINFIILTLILSNGIEIPGYQIQESMLPLFGDSTIQIIGAGIVMVFLAPILEEIFFRGFLLRNLTNNVGAVKANILTATIFAVLHLNFSNIIPIFILGLIINTLTLRSKSIIPSIGFHIFNNAIAFGIELLVLKDLIQIEVLN